VFSSLPAQAQTKNDSLKQLFRDAKTELQAMLEGRLPMNFSRAVFLHENAYLGGTLNYEAFMQAIRFRAEIAKRIAATRPTQGYKKADSLQVQLQASIFKLLTDTTKIRFADEQENGRTGAEVTGFILPARYAWEDFAGQKNWEVMFVSRLIQTNEGNCHSLPYLYKLIADELRVPAWLSSAPHHLYIQGYSQETGLFNTELSSATFPKDSWLMASGYVGKDAIRNRVYLDTLTLKQSISLCLVDLAQGYQRKFEDTGFVLSCLRTAQVAHPKGLSAFLAEIQTLSKVYQTTKQEMDYKRLETLASKVCMLGYQEIPRAEYVRWLANPHQPKSIIEKPNSNESETEGKFSTSPLPTFELNTLSGGKYAEYADLTKPRRIGTLLYSPKTGKILQFVAPDTVVVPVEVSARFLSVDPLTKDYPELTPYQFASNTPIEGIDLDGLEVQHTNNIYGADLLKPTTTTNDAKTFATDYKPRELTVSELSPHEQAEFKNNSKYLNYDLPQDTYKTTITGVSQAERLKDYKEGNGSLTKMTFKDHGVYMLGGPVSIFALGAGGAFAAYTSSSWGPVVINTTTRLVAPLVNTGARLGRQFLNYTLGTNKPALGSGLAAVDAGSQMLVNFVNSKEKGFYSILDAGSRINLTSVAANYRFAAIHTPAMLGSAFQVNLGDLFTGTFIDGHLFKNTIFGDKTASSFLYESSVGSAGNALGLGLSYKSGRGFNFQRQPSIANSSTAFFFSNTLANSETAGNLRTKKP
jgi:hypothetical protein